MQTDFFIQAIYTLVLAASAGIVTFAVCIAVRHLAPIFPWLYGTLERTHVVPYASAMAVVMLGFSFASYVTPATIFAATGLLILSGIKTRRDWPIVVWLIAVLLAMAGAMLADIDMTAQTLPSLKQWGVIAGCVIAVLLFSVSGDAEESMALSLILALVGIALAAVILVPVMTHSFAHGTAASAVVAASGGALLIINRKGMVLSVPASVTVVMTMILGHGAVRLAQDDFVLPAACIVVALLLTGAIAAASGVVRGGVR
jgi:hypothetical protein